MRFAPLGSPVLQRKAGYREVLRWWLRFRTAAELSWEGGEELFHANTQAGSVPLIIAFGQLPKMRASQRIVHVVQYKNHHCACSDGGTRKRPANFEERQKGSIK